MASSASFTLEPEMSPMMGAWERKWISVVTKSFCNQPSVEDHPCMFNAPFWKAFCSRAVLQLTPSVHHPVLHYPPTHKSSMWHKRVNDSLCFVTGNRTKANDNNRSIKLSSVEHISSFLPAHPKSKMHILHTALPQAAGGPGSRQHPQWPERTW